MQAEQSNDKTGGYQMDGLWEKERKRGRERTWTPSRRAFGIFEISIIKPLYRVEI
jgi:hypothetical protein